MVRTVLISAVLAFSASAFAGPLIASQLERRDGRIRFAAGIDSPAVRGKPEEVARTFVLTHRAELGLEGQEIELNRVLKTKLGAVVRFQPVVNGLPIAGVEVTVALDPENRIRRVMSDASPVFGVITERRISPQDALNRAAEGVPMVRHDGTGNIRGEHREIMWVESGIARLSYEVHLDTFDITRNLYVVVDAGTGEIRSRSNRIYHSDEAKVFQPNPGRDGTSKVATVQLKGLLEPRHEDGYLVGELFDTFNCCTNEGCDPTKDPKTIDINLGIFAFKSVICDMQHTASNVKDRFTGDPRTNYDYSNGKPTEYDPPLATSTVGQDPADTDTFAEVHVHHHAAVAYEFFRTHGDPNFVLRDSRRNPPVKPQVWANFLMPDQSSFGGGNITKFARMDNAAFIPREGWQQLGPAPQGTFPDSDALVMFQGSNADFGYDGDVVYHELTHGVIYSTAGFQGIQVDAHGSLNEGGAMHEGFADYFAAAISGDSKVGDYVGPRVPANEAAPPAEGALRDLENDHRCPNLLIGEVHVDSQHFSAALWAARKKVGGATPHTFDAAVFDAMVSLSPMASFGNAANAVANSAAAAFPGRSTAREDVLAEFRSRGVIECDKSLPYTGKRPFYIVEGTSSGIGPYVPGPVQFRITVPKGATELHLVASAEGGGGIFGAPPPQARLFASIGKPVTFNTSQRHALTTDAEFQVSTTFGQNRLSAKLPLTAACGDEIHATLVNTGASAMQLRDVTFSVSASECPEPDAGTPPEDAGVNPEVDAGTSAVIDETGCGCGAAGATPLVFAGLVALTGLARRRRS